MSMEQKETVWSQLADAEPTATSTSAGVGRKVIVVDDRVCVIGKWDVGTEAREVLSDLRQQLRLSSDEGRLITQGVEVSSDEKLSWQDGLPYMFQVVAGGVSVYEVCNTPLPREADAVQTQNTRGRVMTIQLPVAINTKWTQQQVQFQSMLSRCPPVYTLPDIRRSPVASHFILAMALCHQGLEPLNQIISRCKMYNAEWQLGSRQVSSSSSSNFSRSDDMSCNSGRSTGSGSERSSIDTSSGEVDVGNGAAAAAAAAAVVAGSEGSLPAPEFVFALRVHMETFSSEQDVDQVGQAIRDHALAAYIRRHANNSESGFLFRVQKTSLNPSLHLWATASEWYQEQQQLRAAHVAGGGSTSNTNINNSSVFIEGLSSTQQPHAAQEPALGAAAATSSFAAMTATPSSSSAAAAPATAAFPATAAASSSAAPEAATSLDDAIPVGNIPSGARLHGMECYGNIVLVTVVVKPASVMCHAFGMESKRDFVRAVVECSTQQQRNVFDLAHQCNISNKKAQSVVSQAAGYAFFTGTAHFVISCHSVQWIGKLEKVEEVVGKDGNFSLQTTITLSEPIFGKDAGPDYPTARGAYLMLADLTLNRPYHHRQIARPDIEAADTATAAAQQKGDPLKGDDTHRDENDQQQQQQQAQEPEPKQQQQQQQQRQHRQQQRKQQQQNLSILQHIITTYQHFRHKDVQLHTLISDGSTAQVFAGTFNGQQVIVKTLSLDWDSAGTYLIETVVYELLHDLQLAGVLPRLLAHGEYYGLRYCMIFSPAPGNRLSQLPQPYSVEVQQAVQAAAARIHAHGVIHGDLHDNNIFVQLAARAAPKVTIIGLGQAKLASSNNAKQQEMADLQRYTLRASCSSELNT